MPRSATAAVRRSGHDASDVRDIGMGSAADTEIARYARDHGLARVTRDFDFADIRNYPPADYQVGWLFWNCLTMPWQKRLSSCLRAFFVARNG